ncbi:MAG: PAS domain S-box protein [Rubrobacteridae bacterium]|nr:PAS domain S-box protein [Rubrobacteridae bacterium]
MVYPIENRQSKSINEILFAAPYSVVVYDESGRILYVNRQYAEFSGLEQSYIIGKTSEVLGYSPEACELIKEQIKEVIDSKRPIVLEQNVAKSGEIHRFEYSMEPLVLMDVDSSLVVATVRDIREDQSAQGNVAKSQWQVFDVLENIEDGFFALDSSRSKNSCHGLINGLTLMHIRVKTAFMFT